VKNIRLYAALPRAVSPRARKVAASRGPWLARRLRRTRLYRDTRTRARTSTYHD